MSSLFNQSKSLVSQSTWVAFYTLVRREIRRFMRIWVQTLVPPVITMTLYFLIFGQLIGSRVGNMGGIDYMSFIVPGLIMMAVINNAYSNTVSSFFSAKFQKNIEELLVSPTPHWVIVLGFALGGAIRGILVGLIVMVVSSFFVSMPVANWCVLLGVLLLTSLLFSFAGFVNAVFAKSFDDISIIPTFILTPLTYLGGVFYSIELLPSFWQAVTLFNPIVYMVSAFRYGMLGVSDISLWLCFGVLISLCITLFLLSMMLVKKSVGLRS